MDKKLTFFTSILFFLFFTTNAQQTLNQTIMVDGVSRSYILYIPATYDGNSAVPLVFNYHGFTMSATEQMNVCDMRPVADTANFLLVYPQGSLFFGFPHWNVGSWTAGSTADDLGFTAAMIDTLAENYNINQQRVYACGYSNGGYFSFELACQLSDRIAAVAAVAGTMSTETFTACNPMHPMPVMTIHGTADGTVSYNGGTPLNSLSQAAMIAYWVDFNNTEAIPVIIDIPDLNTTDGSTVQYQTYQNGDSCTAVDHYKVNGGGHDWPGSFGNMDIDASSLIWNFVSKYDLNGLINCNITSLNESLAHAEKISLYPNPASDFMTLKSTSGERQKYWIYNTLGAVVISGETNANEHLIDVSNLPASIYFMRTGENTLKFIIKR